MALSQPITMPKTRAQQVDEYAAAHTAMFNKELSAAVNECMTEQSSNPLQFVATCLLQQSSKLSVSERRRDTDRSTSSAASEWTASGWLASMGIEQLLADALLGEGFGVGDELAAISVLGGSATLEDELFARLVTGLGPLVALLAPRLRALATVEAATGGEMQDKFSQETRGMLEYGNLKVRGLRACPLSLRFAEI
jgi:hypothetical protein